MMNRFLSRVAVLVLASPLLAEESPRLPQISEAMQHYIDAGQVPGVVTLVSLKDEVCHREALGRRRPDADEPLKIDDIYWIASMTKPMTATALMMLVDDGQVSIDDPVSKYVPEFADVTLADGSRPRQPVLVRHLLTHTAGIGGYSPQIPETRSLEEQARLIAATPLKWEPGTKWEYGWGLQVIGRVIEVASGQSFESFLQERLFDPLEMRDSTFNLSPEQAARLVPPTQLNPEESREPLIVAKHRYVSDNPATPQTAMPSGGLFSTVDDVYRFYSMVLRNGRIGERQLVSEAAVAAMTSPQVGDLAAGFTPGTTWGLGWCVVTGELQQNRRQDLSIGSFGHGGAFGTQVWVDPALETVTILLIQRTDLGNSDASDIRFSLHDAVARALH